MHLERSLLCMEDVSRCQRLIWILMLTLYRRNSSSRTIYRSRGGYGRALLRMTLLSHVPSVILQEISASIIVWRGTTLWERVPFQVWCRYALEISLAVYEGTNRKTNETVVIKQIRKEYDSPVSIEANLVIYALWTISTASIVRSRFTVPSLILTLFLSWLTMVFDGW